MSTTEQNKALFDHVDTNQDGKIDKGEFNKWLSKTGIGATISYNAANHEIIHSSRDVSQLGRYDYRSSAIRTDLINETTVFTNSIEETETYLERHGIDLCRNPSIVRRTASDQAVDYEQRVFLRYLQPPAPPAPGPLIIEEVEEQLPPPAPLVIREQAAVVSALPPLVLRERPPTPPPAIPTEKTVRVIAGEAQQRSIVIERFGSLPEKPRDIVIERWLPYGPPPERQVIVKRAARTEYPKATCTVVVHENPQARISRKFEVLDVVKADPIDYITRYRDSLLDPATLVQRARREGVLEDIRLPPASIATHTYGRRGIDYDPPKDVIYETYTTRRTVTNNAVPSGLYEKYKSSESSRVADSDVTVTTAVEAEQQDTHASPADVTATSSKDDESVS